MNEKKMMQAARRRSLTFTLVRGAAAIGIALLVAAILIFVSAEGDRLAHTGEALRQLLIGPLFRANGSINVKNICDVLAAMIPTIFTGLATCVMFSANQFNLGAEGGIMLGAFVSALFAVYVPLPAGVLPVVAVLAAAVAVSAMMLIPAVLKAKLGVSEMVNSLMLN